MKNNMLKTMVFIDYESIFWGFYNHYGITPDLRFFIKEIKQRGSLERIMFFGDFTREEINKERQKLRLISSEIIDCAELTGRKNFTDFIMLDHIYRTLLQRPDVEQYVIATGDGHFGNVVAFLTTFMNKKVGVYGVKGTFSRQLKEVATWWSEFEAEKLDIDAHILDLLCNIYQAEKAELYPSFSRTSEIYAREKGMEKAKVNLMLSQLIQRGYIKQEMKILDNNQKVKALSVNLEYLFQFHKDLAEQISRTI